MSNIASTLKEEISRVARKEIRKETEGFKKASAQFRVEISTLKRRIADLEKVVTRISKGTGVDKKDKADPDQAPRVRFSAKGLAALRQRLGLTAADMGALLGVSGQTIYNWEGDKSSPRQKQLEAYAAVRGMGKKQVKAKLQELEG